MKNYFFQYFNPTRLVSTILILGTILSYGVVWLAENTSDHLHFFQFPSTGVLVGLALWGVAHKKIWHKPPFKWLYNMPKVHGRYEGVINYEYEGEKGVKNCTLEVSQDGSKVKVKSFFEGNMEKSISKSFVEKIVLNDDDTFSIVMTYHNSGIDGSTAPHDGTNILEIIENDEGKFLEGKYYTNRYPAQTKGTMKVQWVSDELKNQY